MVVAESEESSSTVAAAPQPQQRQPQPASTEKNGSSSNNSSTDKNAALFTGIDQLVDQALQIYELTAKESATIKSIDSSISMLLGTIRTSLPLSPETFDSYCPGSKSAILNSNGEIIIMQSTGNIVTKKFAELEPGQVIEIVREIVPKLSQGAEALRVAATEEITLLKRMARQLQRVRVQSQQQQQQQQVAAPRAVAET
jgi:hypothetical protein